VLLVRNNRATRSGWSFWLQLEFAANRYDSHETVIGLRHQVALERNTWLCGDRPTSGCMNRRDCVYLGGTITLPILGWLFRKPILYFATADDPAGIGVAHVRAGNAWRKLMKGQN
jgi:hypothetical protein